MRSFFTGIISVFIVTGALATAFWWSGGFAAVRHQIMAAADVSASTAQPITMTEITALPQSDEIVAPQSDTYEGDKKIPVLMYHYVRPITEDMDDIGKGLSVTPEVFAGQMAAVKTLGYETVSLGDIIRNQLPDKPIVITFDDGYEDQYVNALPVLVANNLQATFYITSSFVDKENYMTSGQLLELAKKGMVIANHTVSHVNLADKGLSSERLDEEISAAGTTITEAANAVAYDFCYPSGEFNDTVAAAVRQSGYRTATTTKPGWFQKGDSWWKIPRLRITNETDLASLLSS